MIRAMALSRQQLGELGITDEHLEAQVREMTGRQVKLVGQEDTPLLQMIRKSWFDTVTELARGDRYEIRAGERIGSFGENDPDAHFGPKGPPGR